MSSKTVFVTGISGFTGGHLCQALLDKNYEVRGLCRTKTGLEKFEQQGVKLVVGDLREPDNYRSELDGVDVVYHIAAAFRQVSLTEEEYVGTNVDGSVALVRAAAEANVGRFVHCSTIGVHGDTGKEPVTEDHPFNPPDFYCETKVRGEKAVRELFEKLNLPGVVFRPFGIYGPGDTRFLKLFRGIKRKKFVVLGDGMTLYQMSYIDDLCAGIILCGEHDTAIGEVFLIGGEPAVTLNELFSAVAVAVNSPSPRIRIPIGPVLLAAKACESICRPIGLEPPLYPRRVEFFTKDRTASIDKAKNLLGFSPNISLDKGLAKTAEWYESENLL